ncbi:polysaccharide deacetylase family protein [Sphingomonas sp. AOB5]|nr:polysaccharide deacetylase family protein [Sphingomonas sp. AOB5]MDF7775777.1 polysaccharide deacetylase family protein [Sphingomonas sp. AOB5]
MIVLTFDDLPKHTITPPGMTQVQVAEQIVGALKKAGVLEAYGFINGASGEREPDTAPALRVWRDAGYPLGNHGWSHADLAKISDEQFAEELAKNEPLLRSLMGEADWHWFRYPFLSEAGADPARRARIRALLGAKGYKVAAVTMDFGDWAYNEPYARCMAKGDMAAVATLEAAWLADAEWNIGRYRAMAKALYGRDIPYVLLLHAGAFDAHMLPRLLELYRRHGFRFGTLEEAGRDPYYRTEVNPALAPAPQGLEGAMREKNLPVPAGYQKPPLDSMCR